MLSYIYSTGKSSKVIIKISVNILNVLVYWFIVCDKIYGHPEGPCMSYFLSIAKVVFSRSCDKKKCLLLTISLVSHKNNLTVSVKPVYLCRHLFFKLGCKYLSVYSRCNSVCIYKMKCSITGTFESDCISLFSRLRQHELRHSKVFRSEVQCRKS